MNEKVIVLEAAYNRNTHVNEAKIKVEIAPDACAILSVYIEMGPIGRLRINGISSVDASGFAQLAVFIICHENYIIEKIESQL
jgi:hypothetical protein